MRRVLVLTAALGLAAPAFAQDGDKPNVEAGQDDPLRHPGFGALKWGAPLEAVFKVYPALRGRTPIAKARKALKEGQILILDQKVRFKGRDWPGHLYVDSDGLHRVVLDGEVAHGPEGKGDIDKYLDPLLGSLPAPEKTPDGNRIWKGAETVVTVGTSPLAGADRVTLTFDQASRHKSDDGSVGLD
jgi:hypothetical protein